MVAYNFTPEVLNLHYQISPKSNLISDKKKKKTKKKDLSFLIHLEKYQRQRVQI